MDRLLERGNSIFKCTLFQIHLTAVGLWLADLSCCDCVLAALRTTVKAFE